MSRYRGHSEATARRRRHYARRRDTANLYLPAPLKNFIQKKVRFSFGFFARNFWTAWECVNSYFPLFLCIVEVIDKDLTSNEYREEPRRNTRTYSLCDYPRGPRQKNIRISEDFLRSSCVG